MNRTLGRLSLMLGVALLTATCAIVLQPARGQHTPPNYPITESHAKTPCFGGNICYVCPREDNFGCTADQPAAGYAQGPCQLGYPAGKTCWDTTWSCGKQVKCSGGDTEVDCYSGPWCKN